MADPINPIRNAYITTGKVIAPSDVQSRRITQTGNDTQSFAQVLKKEVEKGDIHFSGHALKRMADRQIHLSEQEMGEMQKAIGKASDKGIRESLVVMGEVAFIVNVPNRTVITAVDGESMKENVFTNIDGAVFI